MSSNSSSGSNNSNKSNNSTSGGSNIRGGGRKSRPGQPAGLEAVFNSPESRLTAISSGADIRRWRTNLIVSGAGVIAFGIWSVIKTLLTMFLTPSGVDDIPELRPYRTLITVSVYGVLALILGTDLCFRLIIGINARAEGHGRKRNWGYVVLALILGGIQLINIGASLFSLISRIPSDFLWVTPAASLIFDITSSITLLELIISAFRLKLRLRQPADGTAGDADKATSEGTAGSQPGTMHKAAAAAAGSSNNGDDGGDDNDDSGAELLDADTALEYIDALEGR